MPASSVDTFFACSLMVLLIVSAMMSTTKIVGPYLNDLANSNETERFRGFVEYVLSNTGTPSDWGKITDTIPTSFGLVPQGKQPYELDLDKISRLNSDNAYALTYRQIVASLGIKDMSFNIKIQPFFDIVITLNSSVSSETNTTYIFQISTSRSGFPVSTLMQCYAVVGTYVNTVSSSTSSSGAGSVDVALPKSQNGTALLLVFAKAKAYGQTMSFAVHSFSHNSEIPEPNGSFLQLSPLNHVLNVSFRYPTVDVSSAYVFSYGYSFNLSQASSGNQTLEYTIPNLLEASPMLLMVNGNNGSESFAEWTAYPQLSVEIGADFSDSTIKSKVASLTYVVSVSSVLYECIIKCRGVEL